MTPREKRRLIRTRVDSYLYAMEILAKTFGGLQLDRFTDETWKAYHAALENLAKHAAEEAAKLADL